MTARPVIPTCIEILEGYREGRVLQFHAEHLREAEFLRRLLIITFGMTADEESQQYDPETSPVLFHWDEENREARLQLPVKPDFPIPAAAMKSALQHLLENILNFTSKAPHHSAGKHHGEIFNPCHDREEAEVLRNILGVLAASHHPKHSEEEVLKHIFVRNGDTHNPPGVVVQGAILDLISEGEGKNMPRCAVN